MIEKVEFSESTSHSNTASAADADVWTQLAEFASRTDADPVLRLLVGEAIASHHNLRGVTATIATRYRAMLDAVPDGITIHDETGRILDANASACQLLDLQRDLLLGRSLEDALPGLDREFVKHLQHTFDGDEIVSASSTIRRSNGEEAIVELNAHGYLDANQKRIIAVTRDLGPRALADLQLRNSNAELRRVLHDMDKGFLVRNRMGHVLSCNPAACRILQTSEPDLLALRSDQIADWQFIDEHGAAMAQDDLPCARALCTGKAIESVICGIKSPGMIDPRWLSVTAVPRAGNADGEPEEVVAVFADVTAIKREAALFTHAQSLTNLGAWQVAADGERMFWSAHMHAIFDVPLSTPVSRERMLDHFAGMDQRRLRQTLDAAKVCETTEITARMTTAIGRRRQLRIRIRALPEGSAQGKVIGCVQDITAAADPESAAALD